MGNEQKFADAMQELEEIVRKLEQGDVQLEEAIDLYKKEWNYLIFAMTNCKMLKNS